MPDPNVPEWDTPGSDIQHQDDPEWDVLDQDVQYPDVQYQDTADWYVPEPRDDQGRLRERFVPKTLFGLVTMLLVAAISAGVSGVVLYAYYEYRLQRSEDRVEKFIEGFDQRYEEAIAGIADERDVAKAELRKELEPLEELRATGETLNDLLKQVEGSVFFVETLDELGQPSVGSAFVVLSETDRSFLVTSLAVVKAATVTPAPTMRLRKGTSNYDAAIWAWDEERDLALLSIKRGNLTRLPWAPEKPAIRLGSRVFAISGIGGAGGAITQGFVADVSSSGILTDAPISGSFVGAPLLNSKGEVIAVASRAYAPLGFTSDRVVFAPPIRAACAKVLRCPNGTVSAPDKS